MVSFFYTVLISLLLIRIFSESVSVCILTLLINASIYLSIVSHAVIFASLLCIINNLSCHSLSILLFIYILATLLQLPSSSRLTLTFVPLTDSCVQHSAYRVEYMHYLYP